MFRGRFEHNIDNKGRTSLPSRFREVLAAEGHTRLVLTSGLDPCVVAYPMAEWLSFEERLAALPQFDPDVAMVRRIYLSAATEVEVDKLGRLLVPSSLRAHARLARVALWAGMGRHAELWSKESFDEFHQAVLRDHEKREGIARKLAELGL